MCLILGGVNIQRKKHFKQKSAALREPKRGYARLRHILLCKESRTVDKNKLRMTGFECFAIFVIRRAKHAPKGAARHRRQELVSELK